MNNRTKEKLSGAVYSFLRELIQTADEENYDRDSFVRSSAAMFSEMVEVSTFKEFQTKNGEANG